MHAVATVTGGHTVLSTIPEELTRGKLTRLGEGIAKVVYASEHWVVSRERSPLEVVALIVLWRSLRGVERIIPGAWGRRLRERPGRQIRFLRVLVHGAILILPRTLWYGSHVRYVFRLYHKRNLRGEKLAESYLTDSGLIPRRVEFPPERVRIGGWPGWLMVSEATQRLDSTLYDKMTQLARADRFEELEVWLERLLQTRAEGWRRGLFSLDAHLKNFGAIGDRIVLLDTGGLTNRWSEVEERLEIVERSSIAPHRQLGLGPMLADHPEIARRFDEKWKATVNVEVVRGFWPR